MKAVSRLWEKPINMKKELRKSQLKEAGLKKNSNRKIDTTNLWKKVERSYA